MRKLLVLISVCMLSLSADDRLSQLKSAIVRSDDKAVDVLLRQGPLSSSVIYELCGWADDLVEERTLLVPTRAELAGGYLGWLGLGALSSAAALYWFNKYWFHKRRLLSRLTSYVITRNKTMLGVIAGGCTAASLYGISRKVRGPKNRLERARAIKNELEQQLTLYRKE